MQKVAVYGTLRKGQRNHHLLKSSRYVGLYSFYLPFRMYKVGLYYPALVPDEADNLITIEVYEVTNATMNGLDKLENYPTYYDRFPVECNGEEVWIYYLEKSKENLSTFTCEIPGGDWVHHELSA